MNFLKKIFSKESEKQVQEPQPTGTPRWIEQYKFNLIDTTDFDYEMRHFPFIPVLPVYESKCFDVIKRVMIQYVGLEHTVNPELITRDCEFEDISFDSLSRSELLILLEEKYHIDLSQVELKNSHTIGELCDILGNAIAEKHGVQYIKEPIPQEPYEVYTSAKKGKKMTNLLPNTYKIKPESVFYNVKQILLVQNHNKAIDLTPDMQMVSDLHISGKKLLELVNELEKRYNKTIVSHSKLQSAKTLNDFCVIFANDLNLTSKTNLKSYYQKHIGLMVQKIKSKVK